MGDNVVLRVAHAPKEALLMRLCHIGTNILFQRGHAFLQEKLEFRGGKVLVRIENTRCHTHRVIVLPCVFRLLHSDLSAVAVARTRPAAHSHRASMSYRQSWF